VRLSESWYFIPVAISNALFPAVVNAKAISKEIYLSRLQKLYDILAWIAICIAIPVSFLSNQIITILYGKEFLPASPVLTIYIWAGVAVFLGVASSQFLVTENLTKISFYRTTLGMITNVILNLIMIPKYGIVGSAIATLISYSIAVISIVSFKNLSKIFTMMLRAILFVDLFKILIHKIQNEKY
jgi:O-antigen/teichoic acid export membrane protein